MAPSVNTTKPFPEETHKNLEDLAPWQNNEAFELG
jgi:hypothetical protein